MLGDIKNGNLIIAKGFLFLILGLLSASILMIYAPSLTVATLLAICIWSFCRFYYFAFYVIEHYVDSQYRFAGLTDFLRYLLRSKKKPTT